jgi:transcriptional regulator with XRE-family HTH domain
MFKKGIAYKIREIRKNKGFTLVQLGKEAGLSEGLLSRMKNNQVSPFIATLSKIARGLEVLISIFFEENESMQKGYAVTPNNNRK